MKLPDADQRAEQSPAQGEGKSSAELWGRIWANQNVVRALERVERNGGAPGIDGMTVEELRPYLRSTGWNSGKRSTSKAITRAQSGG